MNTPFWISHILSDVERGNTYWMDRPCMHGVWRRARGGLLWEREPTHSAMLRLPSQ